MRTGISGKHTKKLNHQVITLNMLTHQFIIKLVCVVKW